MAEPRYATYLDESALPYFFCPGCGHGQIADHLNIALVRLQLDPHQVVIVTDIGCSGLTDKYFKTNAVHGLHGRSITYATGIKLANPALKVIVLTGDGGCGIGGHHLINAARRNIGITVVVFNNLNYGMTGGQHSAATPPGGLTPTTPFGQLERPMDLCQTAAVNGASLAARTTSFDQDLPELLAAAIENEGFTIIDIWELCTAYYAPQNRFSRKSLFETLAALNFPTGILHQERRPEYAQAYRQAAASLIEQPLLSVQPVTPQYTACLQDELNIIVAGAAGKKINTAAAAFCRGAVLAGLWAEMRSDYPVTVKSGHSISEVTLSAEPGGTAEGSSRSIFMVLFKEGLANLRGRLKELASTDLVYLDQALGPLDTPSRLVLLDLAAAGRAGIKPEYWAPWALARLLADHPVFPLDAFQGAAALYPAFASPSLAAIQAGARSAAG